NGYARYDLNGTQATPPWGLIDPAYQNYSPVKPKTSDLQPGFTIGGPLLPMFHSMQDRLFFFLGFNPELNRLATNVNYGTASEGGAGLGIVPFSQNTNTYYTNARIDAKVS